MPTAQQTALVHKYCAVCHTDAAKNGGLSLQHYDAARPDPALAAMLLSKLRNGAMGAAGLGIPDKPTQEAWVAATAAQAAGAASWTVMHGDSTVVKGSVVTASMVREVAPRKPAADAPVYRLTVTCDGASRQGEMQLSWSPDPQTNRGFLVSADDKHTISHTLTGQERMGNGTTGTSGRASATLRAPLPATSLTVTDLFPGETVVFPFDALTQSTRRDLMACY